MSLVQQIIELIHQQWKQADPTLPALSAVYRWLEQNDLDAQGRRSGPRCGWSFVVPVALSAWYCSARLAYSLAVLLPVGRLLIAMFLHVPSPFPYIVVNSLIRVAVLVFIAFLASRAARQTEELQQRVNTLVTICAWSRTVEYQGEWISFEEYLLRRFNINTSHGISPAEREKIFKDLESRDRQI